MWYEIYDEQTNKTLRVKGESLEQAEGIADTLDFNDFSDGDEVDVLNDIDNYIE
jgi:hypothetical protein